MKLLNEILGTKYPIIQGGMANIATGEFAAACSNAGALGLIALTALVTLNTRLAPMWMIAVGAAAGALGLV